MGQMGVFIAALLMAIFLYFKAFLPLASVGWDEGAHLLDAFKVAAPLHRGAVIEALRQSANQIVYPPAYSWLVAIWSLAGGVSLESFRLFSLAVYVVAAIAIYLVTDGLLKSLKFSRGGSGAAGMIAAFLFLTAPLFWILSVQAMIETTGVLITVAVVGLIIKAYEQTLRPSRGRWMAVAVGMTVLFFTKYNYGTIIFFGLVAEWVVAVWLFGLAGFRNNFKSAFAVLGSLVTFLLIWVILPGRVATFIGVLSDPITYSYEAISFWQHIFWFFPMSLSLDYLASPLLVLAYMSGIYFVFKFWRNPSVRVIFFIFLANLAAGILHMNNQQERYIATAVPLLYMLSAGGFVELAKQARHITGQKKKVMVIAGLIMGVLVMKDFISNIANVRAIGEHLLTSPIYGCKQFQVTQFDFNKANWVCGDRLGQLPRGAVDWVLANTDLNKPLYYLGATNEISPTVLEFLRAVQRYNKIDAKPTSLWPQYALTVEVEPDSILDTYDYRKQNRGRNEQGLAAVIADSRWVNVARKNFNELGVTLTIWGWNGI
ncbi:MAG: hypothetical protein UX31_C0008G0012 [Candidatus Nomurabacteria bacterium GW2011_GWA1_46_11]|uniref:Glycosyltransferase RgtA/B/C/D-like domain-containing protein n=1 Tax=Candidatus Nomurabacteria bacterium GW2011_GWA1_46_11 TaxID=1618732 RepID=A0A0G1RM08_9BACT|nr:MAG: hypothetical protein UX31_C0008G0012 [Candidatus Nomurabacteria bacterium GW2011_GWA1_46_11]